jgi:hypothetical protein
LTASPWLPVFPPEAEIVTVDPHVSKVPKPEVVVAWLLYGRSPIE